MHEAFNQLPLVKKMSFAKISVLLLCVFVLCLSVGCGGGKSSTDIPTLYKNAGENHKYNVEFNKYIIGLTDDMVVNAKHLIQKSVEMQKVFDKHNKESEDLELALLFNNIDNFLTHVKNSYTNLKGEMVDGLLIEINEGRIIWRNDGNNSGYYYKNRPIKFYLLKPNSSGKFGDVASSKLELVDLSPSKEDQKNSKTKDFDLLLYGRSNFASSGYNMGWPSNRDAHILWANGEVYMASGVRNDQKNHVCICVLAKPGDIAAGVLNGTFPFKEDIAGEILESYAEFLQSFVGRYDSSRQKYLLDKYAGALNSKVNSSEKKVGQQQSNVTQSSPVNPGSSQQPYVVNSAPQVKKQKMFNPIDTPQSVAIMKGIAGTSSSSALKDGGKEYSASNIVDSNNQTCWADGVSGLGVGESITINFNQKFNISGFRIFNGYQKSEDLFNKNSRPTVLRVIGSDGSNEVYNLEDTFYEQDIYFKNMIKVDSIKLVLEKVQRGSKYDDTCISEVIFF